MGERDGSFGSRWLLITRRLRNVAPLAKRTRRIPSRADRGPELLRHCPGLPQRSIFPSLALFYRLGLSRRWWTLAFTQRSATHAGSFTTQSAPLNHLHLIILAFGPAAKKATDKQERGPYRALQLLIQNSQTASCRENLGMAAAARATSAGLQTLTAASDSADVTSRVRLRYLWLVGGVEDERPHVCPQPGGTAPPAVLLGCSAVLLRQDCGDTTKRYGALGGVPRDRQE